MSCDPIPGGFACSRTKRATRRCSVSGCPYLADKLCDYRKPKGGTCDKPLCKMHAVNVGEDRDHCPDHQHGQKELAI